MKKITLLFILALSLNASAQFTNVVLPTQVKTNATEGTNTYNVAFDYTFTGATDLNTITYTTIRIRPITATEVKDPAFANTD
ncbi:hypothetical protein [Flavobacterium ovatum]|uniref:hypothetical protein n=1 Tax=Flavobacterium ovatum TaxID=1928857 RepID=UPI00344F106D